MARALEMLQAEAEWLHEQKGSLESKIERAFAQFERGEYFSAEESRADMEERKGEWVAEQRRR